ncbi:UNVERIFIED_CONTAM: hypothetical protein GTU68_031437 [Idotea baltica]|nr:hypothetical protein [Idotea baltica]
MLINRQQLAHLKLSLMITRKK